MRIADVSVELIQSPDGRRWTHVLVSTDGGITGIGEATYSFKETVVAEMVNVLSDRVVGRSIFDTEAIYYDLYSHGLAGYRTGGVMFTSAISGIDQALWDLKGKVLGAPVSALLGGPRHTKVPVYVHFGGLTLKARIQDAQDRISEGFRAIKSTTCIWIAAGPRVTRDQLRRIDEAYLALRDAVGDNIELMDDAHAAYDARSGLEIARVLEPYRLLFLEEPTIPEDPAGYARIRAATSTTIAGSERLTSKYRFHDFFKAGAVDVAQPDIAYIGGITEMKKVATVADLYQVVIAPHNTKGPVGTMAAAHVMASIPNALIQELVAPSWIPWRNDVLREPLVLEDGAIVIPDRPGLGVEFDDTRLRDHRLVGQRAEDLPAVDHARTTQR